MQQQPRRLYRQVSVQIHYSVTMPSLSHDRNVQQTLSCQTPPSASSVFCFLDLPFPEPSLLPSYGHRPFVITCNSHKPCGFYALGQVSSFSASLAFHPPRANQGFPSGVQDLDACSTSVLNISKPFVRAWTKAIRIRCKVNSNSHIFFTPCIWNTNNESHSVLFILIPY